MFPDEQRPHRHTEKAVGVLEADLPAGTLSLIALRNPKELLSDFP